MTFDYSPSADSKSVRRFLRAARDLRDQLGDGLEQIDMGGDAAAECVRRDVDAHARKARALPLDGQVLEVLVGDLERREPMSTELDGHGCSEAAGNDERVEVVRARWVASPTSPVPRQGVRLTAMTPVATTTEWIAIQTPWTVRS